MPRSLTITLLGTGTSAGIPMIGCRCPVCTSHDPRDRRDRTAAMIELPDPEGHTRRILIDTAPELRQQMVRHDIDRIDGVIYTHNHADHVFGLDDLRRFNALQNQPIDLFAEPRVIEYLHHTFQYIFQPHKNINDSFIPSLITHPINPLAPLTLFGQDILPLRLLHGKLPVLAFRIANLAYCTDVSNIPPETWPHLQDLDLLILDGLRYKHHPTHLTIDQALTIIDQLQPRRAYLTHIAHDIKHAELDPKLPDNVALAYDGLALETDL